MKHRWGEEDNKLKKKTAYTTLIGGHKNFPLRGTFSIVHQYCTNFVSGLKYVRIRQCLPYAPLEACQGRGRHTQSVLISLSAVHILHDLLINVIKLKTLAACIK